MRRLTKEEFRRTDNESPLSLYYQGIKAKETKEKYTRTLRHIFCKVFEEIFEGSFEDRIDQFVRYSRKDPKYATDLMLNLSRILRERTELPKNDPDYFKPTSVDNYFKPIKKLLDMNEIPLAWSRVYVTFPEIDNISGGRGWTRQEISRMLKFANGSMERAIILVLSSSAARIGGIDFTWKDIMPVYKVGNELKIDITESEESESSIACAMLKTYSGTSCEYPSFITPEAYSAIMDYKTEWIRDVGREPEPCQPLFKTDGDLPRKLTPTAIKKRIGRIVKDASLRPPLSKGERRYDVPLMNGFRRFCNKTLKESLSKDSPLGSLIKKEFIIGHSGLVKTDRNYFKTHVLELAEEYLNAVKDLTISNEERLRADKVKLQKEKKEIERYSVEKIKKLAQDSLKMQETIRDFISFEYEDNPEEKARKMQLFSKKYNLSGKGTPRLEFIMPEEMQKVTKNLSKPTKISHTGIELK